MKRVGLDSDRPSPTQTQLLPAIAVEALQEVAAIAIVMLPTDLKCSSAIHRRSCYPKTKDCQALLPYG